MPVTKEDVQVIAWTVEIVVLVSALIGGRYVWRMARRAARKERERAGQARR